MARLNHAGGAVITTLASDILSTTLTINIVSATGWPLGGVNGEFVITIDPDLTTEERILVASRSGTTLTVANTSKRGVDGTTAVAHSTGARVIHSFSGFEADEANRHINDITIDEHTQYMRADGTRHDLTARHSAGSVVPTAAPVAIGTVLAEGAGTNAARSTHVHVVGVGAINVANMFAAGVVDSTALANDSVIAGKIAVGGIDAADNFAAGVVDQAAIGADAVGPSELADNSVANANIIDATIVPSTKINHEAPAAYSPLWTSTGTAPSLGNGTLVGRFLRYGRLIFFEVELTWGTTTSGGTGDWRFSIPVASATTGGFPVASLTIMNNSGTRFVGVNILGPANTEFRILERVTLNDASATSPFTWGTADFLQVTGAFISAS